MLKIVKWTTGAAIFFSHLDHASCYNPQLLDSVADSFNARICVKAPISIKQIQENLSFLEEEDNSYVTTYSGRNVFESYNEKIKNKAGEFSTFYNNCKKIYDANDMVDPVTQTAVQMIFERVFQKHEQHLNLLSSTNHLLPTRKAAGDAKGVDRDLPKDVDPLGKKSAESRKDLSENIPTGYEDRAADHLFRSNQKLVDSH
ncbi:MAG: hypothetical protein K2W92_04580 [Alphaproteobacteria bacterium]|nr:hypothetical protein [Alphaproteobacteria bacterium]